MTRALLLFSVLLALPATAAPRSIFLPNALVPEAQTLRLTLFELVAPSVSYAVSDHVELSAGGAWIPLSDTVVAAGGRARLFQSPELSVAVFGGFAVDVPVAGQPLYAPQLGVAFTTDGLWHEDLQLNLAVFTLVPFNVVTADVVVVIAPGVRYALFDWLALNAEVQLRGIAPYFQAGITPAVALTGRWGWFSMDVGWIFDVGVVGPPLFLLNSGGIPLVNLEARF